VNPWAQRKAAQEAKEAAAPPAPAVSDDNNNNNSTGGGRDLRASVDDLRASADDLPVQRDSRFNARNKNKTTRSLPRDRSDQRERQLTVDVRGGGRTATGFQGGVNYSLGKKKRWENVQEGQPLPSPAVLGIVVPPNVAQGAAAPVVHFADNARDQRRITSVAREEQRAADPEHQRLAREDEAAQQAAGWAVVRGRKGDIVKQKRQPGKKGVRRDDDNDDNDAPRQRGGPRRVAGGRSGDHPERRRRDQDSHDQQAQERETAHQQTAATSEQATRNAPLVAFVSDTRGNEIRDGQYGSRWRDEKETGPRDSNARVINKDIAAGRF
jgi:hypothetical protein